MTFTPAIQMVGMPIIWVTDDPCPACGTTLTLADDGGRVVVECRSCGYADTWTADEPTGGDR
jgi:Zn ribbon nucleic-acid-binding protein